MAEVTSNKLAGRKKKAQSDVDTYIRRTKEKMIDQGDIDESYFVGALWSDPFENYGEYYKSITQDQFIHDVWAFYFQIGKLMYEEGVKEFDKITVFNFVKKNGVESVFEEYGGMGTIEDLKALTQDGTKNIEHYYNAIIRSFTIRELINLYGDKVLIEDGRYDYTRLNSEQLVKYWQDKINSLAMTTVKSHQAVNALIDGKQFIKNLKRKSGDMLPLFDSPYMNAITGGIPRGHVTMLGGFGGQGKTSLTVDKLVSSFIINKQKAVIILNEEDEDSFRQKVVLRLLEYYTKGKKKIRRKNMVSGHLTEYEEEQIMYVMDRWKEAVDGNESMMKIVYMEKYVMKDVEKIFRLYANRGYVNFIIDTHKVSDDSTHDMRWETFVEDMKTIYRLTKANGGLNLRTVVTFQLADSAIRNRFLDYDAIGEGKASKNEASIVYMFRSVWSDEYENKKNALVVEGLTPNKIDKNVNDIFYLEEGKTYYLLFYPKNRFGQSTENGGRVLVLEPDFRTNTFKEIGWTTVGNERSGR